MSDHFLVLPLLERGLEVAVGDLLVGRRRRCELEQKQSSKCRPRYQRFNGVFLSMV